MADRNVLSQGGFNRCVLGREGYVLYNSNDIYVGQAIERYGEYGEVEAQLLRQMCRPGSVAVELGANIGTHTQVLARCVGPGGFVYAYEPQRIVFQTLCANLALNSITNVDARCAAAGARGGVVRIPDFDYTQRNNFGGVEVKSFTRGRKVPLVTLDDDLELDRLDVIKVDVEGMELEALQGAAAHIRRFQPMLLLENDRIESSEALIRYLLALDYRLYWHTPPLFNRDNFFAERENVYPNVISVNMLAMPRAMPQNIRGMPEITDPTDHPHTRKRKAPGGG